MAEESFLYDKEQNADFRGFWLQYYESFEDKKKRISTDFDR